MPLDYDTDAKVEEPSRAKPGCYEFKVDDIEEKKFDSGNKGLKVQFLVAVGKRDLKVFENFVYAPKSLWRLKEFMTAIGLDFHAKNELWDFQNKTGRANFVIGDNGYLKVKSFVMPEAGGIPPREPGSDDVPW